MKKLSILILLIFLLSSLCLGQQIRPSYKQGFARSAAESAHPSYWRGLVGYWAPNLGISGLVIHDIANGKKNGVFQAGMDGTDWSITPLGSVVDYDSGANDYVLTTHNGLLGGGKKTIMIWCQTSATVVVTVDGLLNFGASGVGNRIGIGMDEVGKVIRVEMDGGSLQGTAAINDGVFHCIVCVQTGTTFDTFLLYLDGKDETIASITGGATTVSPVAGEAVIFGDRALGIAKYWSGQIGNICLWERALTPAEIKFLYENPMALLQLRPRIFKAPTVLPARRNIIVSQLIDTIYFYYLLN